MSIFWLALCTLVISFLFLLVCYYCCCVQWYLNMTIEIVGVTVRNVFMPNEKLDQQHRVYNGFAGNSERTQLTNRRVICFLSDFLVIILKRIWCLHDTFSFFCWSFAASTLERDGKTTDATAPEEQAVPDAQYSTLIKEPPTHSWGRIQDDGTWNRRQRVGSSHQRNLFQS